MNSEHQTLRQELHQAGAKSSEMDELVSVADQLRLLKTAPASSKSRRWIKPLRPALIALPVLALSLIIIMLAQSAMPTSWLYPVQKMSDAVAVKIHPEYRATVMMRRADQVNELVNSHASRQLILSTLDSYQAEAADYKTLPHTSYAAFEYCETTLKQAAAAAPTDVRQAITNSLDSLQTS